MKRLLAILLSVLMLCTMIPFASISAADEPTIEIVVDEAELNPGDEFEVTVNLLNIPEPGLIAALVKLDWDKDAMEIVTYYDEDEEDYFPMIEVGPKYNASSNKYISFGPLGTCNVNYVRGTATATQTRYEEYFFTATFRIKDDARSGNYTITMKDKDYNPKNFVRYGNLATDFAIEGTTVTVKGDAPSFDGYVTNGDFETGDATGWETWLPSEICSDAAYEGAYGAHMIGEGGWGTLLSQTIPVEAGKTYELSFWTKVNNIGANLQIYDGTWSGTLLIGDWLSDYNYDTWTQVAYTVTPDTDALFLNFCGAGTGAIEDVYVDAVTVKELAPATSDGYIINGDFETGTIDPWDNLWGNNTVTMVEGRNGGWAMQVQSGQWKHVRQLVAVEPNTAYTITYWAKDVYCASLLIKDSSDSYNIADAYMGGGAEWTLNTTTFNSGDNTAVYVSFMGTDYTAYYTVDDVVMTYAGYVCPHEYDNDCDAYCNICGDYRIPGSHEYSSFCDDCCNVCGAYRSVTHTYDNDYDASCNVCGAVREVSIPATIYGVASLDSVEVGETFALNVYIQDNPGMVGWNVTVGFDETAFELISQYSGDAFPSSGISFGPLRSPASATYASFINPDVTNNGWMYSLEFKVKDTAAAGDYDFVLGTLYNDADNFCNANWETVPVSFADTTVTVEPHTHTYDDIYDTTCNVCGAVRELIEPGATATLDFTDIANRVSYSTEQQVWSQNGITVTNDKGASTSYVGDYGGNGYPARFYKSSTVTIEYPGIYEIVIDCGSLDAKYINGWANSITDANATAIVDGGIVTITFTSLVNSFTWETLTAQSRAYSITVNPNGIPACTHEYDNACDVDCNLCGEYREVMVHQYISTVTQAATCISAGVMTYECSSCGTTYTEVIPSTGVHEYLYDCDTHCMHCGEKTNYYAEHSIIHVEATNPVSCIEYGNVEYWYCDICHTIWLDEDCRVQSNMLSVRIPGECISDAVYDCQEGLCINCGLPCYDAVADHTYSNASDATCNVCGAIREVDNPPTIYGTVDKTTVAVGETFTMYVYMENNPGLVAWMLEVDFDSTALELVNQIKGDAFDSSGFSFGPMSEGYTNALWYDFLAGDYTNNGCLFALTFLVKENAPIGDLAIDLYCSDPENFCNLAFEEVEFDIQDASVTIVEHIHEYDNACDAYCNICGEYRTPAAHIYDNTCDTYCNVCGTYRSITHTYDNACDAYCNICGSYRTPAAHVYSHTADTTCDVCGAVRVLNYDFTIYGEVDIPSAERGDTVVLNVFIKDNPGLIGWNVTVDFDESAFELLKMNVGTVFPASGMSYSKVQDQSPTIATFVDGLAYEDYTGDGLMFSLVFKVKDTAALGDYTFILNTKDVDSFMNLAWDYFLVGFEDVSTEVVAHIHTYVPAVTAPTCESEGYTTYTCSTCGGYYVADYVAALGHDYWGVVTAPTCEDEGYTTYTCSRCGDTYVADYVAALGHDYYVNLTDPTCANKGYAIYTCSRCGDSYSVTIPATGNHTYDNACDAECNVCGIYRTPADHVYSHIADTTCNVCGAVRVLNYDFTIYGEMDVTSAERGDTVVLNVFIKDNPGLTGWSVTVDFDKTAFELLQFKAGTIFPTSGMSYSKVQNQSPAVVTFVDGLASADYTGDGLLFSLVLKVKDTAALGDYTFILDTSDMDNFMNVDLDYFLVDFEDAPMEVVAHIHTFVPVVTDPTCEDEGYTTYTCSVCGDSYVDDYIDALGHAYESVVTAPTCEDQGYTTHTCSRCGNSYVDSYVNALGHAYASEVTTDPTCGTKGVRTYTCTVCGHSYTEEIPATGNHTYDNVCDAECNVCGHVREVPAHVYVGSFTCQNCGNALDLTSDRIIYGTTDMSTVVPGDTFTVAVNIANNPGLVGWLVEVNYDLNVLEMIAQTKGDTFTSGDMTFGPMDKLPSNVLWFDFLNPDVTNDGVLFTFTFRVKEGATLGESGIYLSCSDPDNICNALDQTVYFDFVSALLTVMDHHHTYDHACDADCNICGELREVEPHVYEYACSETCSVCGSANPEAAEHVYDHDYDATCNVCGAKREVIGILGDTNGDQRVNIRDIALYQQFMNGWDTPDFIRELADVNGDGRCNIRDIAVLQQYLNGWDVEFPVGQQ